MLTVKEGNRERKKIPKAPVFYSLCRPEGGEGEGEMERNWIGMGLGYGCGEPEADGVEINY